MDTSGGGGGVRRISKSDQELLCKFGLVRPLRRRQFQLDPVGWKIPFKGIDLMDLSSFLIQLYWRMLQDAPGCSGMLRDSLESFGDDFKMLQDSPEMLKEGLGCSGMLEDSMRILKDSTGSSREFF